MQKYDYISALRGFAILGVVLVHCSNFVHPSSTILSKIAIQGARGIQLFYLVSALTLFLSMKVRKHQETSPLVSFFIRRFFRIAPLFYLAIIIFTAFYRWSNGYWAPNGPNWWSIALTVFFIHGWHPETINSVVPGGWSIAVEMTFYCLVPYLYVKIRSINYALIVLFGSLILSKVSSCMVMNLYKPFYPDNLHYLVRAFSTLWFFSQLPVFILGILLFHIIEKFPYTDRKISLLFLLSSFFAFIVLLTAYPYSKLLDEHFLYAIALFFFSLSLHFFSNSFFVNRMTVLIGKLSYSLYITHFLVLNVMESVFENGFIISGDGGFIVAYLLILIVSTAISWVLYNLIELPGINLGKNIIRRL